MFLNYNTNSGISCRPYRNQGVTCGELSEFLESSSRGEESNLSFSYHDIEGFMDALCCGEYLSEFDVNEHDIDAIYETLSKVVDAR